MGDVKTNGSNSQSRRFLSALNINSLKTGLLHINESTRTRVLKSGGAAPPPMEHKAQSRVHSQNQALLNITDFQAMLTTVEDSFETILDVLTEMKSLAADAAAIQDGTIYQKRGPGSEGYINGNRGHEDMSALRTAYKDRLTELSEEIDEIVQDTNYYGKPLFGDQTTSFNLFVNVSRGDTPAVSVDPLSAAELSVAADDIRVSDNDAAGATLENIGDAMNDIQQRLNDLVSVKDRLTIKYENLKTSRSVHNAALDEVKNVDSARKRLESTKLQIIAESNAALMAQANATANSTMHLAAAVHRNDDGPLARIYSIDRDRDSGPVTHLRRIMLGQSSERPAFSTFSERDA